MRCSMPRQNRISRPGLMRHRRARRSTVRWDLSRCWNCGGCGWRIARREAEVPDFCRPAASTNSSRAIAAPWVSIAAPLLSELAGRPGSRLLSNGDAMALVRDGRKARHIGPLFAGDSGSSARSGRVRSLRSETGPLLIDAVNSQDEFLQGLAGAGWNIERPFQRMRFGRAIVPAAETAVRRRRPGIWMRERRHAS